MTRSGSGLWTSGPDGRTPVTRDGAVSGLTWATTVQGPAELSVTVAAQPGADLISLRARRRMIVHDAGVRLWSGTLGEPERGSPWQVKGSGLQALAKDYLVRPSTANYWDVAAQVDAAIARGLPWTRIGFPPAVPGTPDPPTTITALDQLLSSHAALTNVEWVLDAYGNLSWQTAPSADGPPTFLALPGDDPGGWTDSGFANSLTADYTDENGLAASQTLESQVSINALGREEAALDLTDLGGLSSTAVQNALTATLARTSRRLRLTGGVDLGRGRCLVAPGGGAVDLRVVSAVGGPVVRLLGVRPPSYAQVTPSLAVQFRLGATSYSEDTKTLTLTPLESSGDTFADLLRPQELPV